MRALVTGATGFVGSNLVDHLLNTGYEITALVRSPQKMRDAWKNDPRVTVVFSDIDGFLKNDETYEPFDVVYHFSWAGTSGALRADERVQLENVQNTCDMVRYAAKNGAKRFVFAGSIMEYEAQKFVGGDEKRPAAATIYSTAKLTADYMAKALAAQLGIEYVNVLISNIYGPGERSARFVNTMLKKMHNGETCDLSSGVQLYDFIYVDDAVTAIELAGRSGANGGEYYIGNVEQKPLKSFVIEMNGIVNKGAVLNFGAVGSQGNFLDYTEFSTHKLKDDLGFKPNYSFETGIRNTYEWLISED